MLLDHSTSSYYSSIFDNLLIFYALSMGLSELIAELKYCEGDPAYMVQVQNQGYATFLHISDIMVPINYRVIIHIL
jgi:hypothetical protein